MKDQVVRSRHLDREAANRGSVFHDYTIFLWLLKLGALLNLYFIVKTPPFGGGTDAYVVVPAQILFIVSAYRCLYPVRYEHNVVFHDSVFSSIFVTRLLATFSEVAYIFLFSHVLRLLNVNHTEWVNALSWLMVLVVVISQGFVWAAILTEQLQLYVYEEAGWFLIFLMNTIASAYLYLIISVSGESDRLLLLNLLFGIAYLPWQTMHLRSLHLESSRSRQTVAAGSQSIPARLARALSVKNRRTDAASWGGLIGLTWMTAYWATLIPLWVYYIAGVLRPR